MLNQKQRALLTQFYYAKHHRQAYKVSPEDMEYLIEGLVLENSILATEQRGASNASLDKALKEIDEENHHDEPRTIV